MRNSLPGTFGTSGVIDVRPSSLFNILLTGGGVDWLNTAFSDCAFARCLLIPDVCV